MSTNKGPRIGVVKLSDIAKAPGMRMDAEYHLSQKEGSDLPTPENRWLIDSGSGLIEAWDHLDNPESGNDTSALVLCIGTLGREDWSHPAHSRKEAAEAAAFTLLAWRSHDKRDDPTK